MNECMTFRVSCSIRDEIEELLISGGTEGVGGLIVKQVSR